MAITGSATVTISVTMTSVTVSPSSVSLTASTGTQQFTATAHYNDGSTASVPVTWTASGGTITSSGFYTAGSTTGTFAVHATAVSTGLVGTATVNIPSSSLLWNATFDGGVWPPGKIIQACNSNRVTIYNVAAKPAGAPDPRIGNYALAIRTLNADKWPDCFASSTHFSRSQVLSPDFIKPGMELWEEFSLCIPSNFPTMADGTFFLFQEDYGAPFQSNPPSAWYLQNYNGVLHLQLTGNYVAATKAVSPMWHGPVTKGSWMVILQHKLYKPDTSGFMEAWVNGVQVSTKKNMQTMLTGSTSFTCDLNHYRRATMFPDPGDVTIYFDHWRVGTTRASVDSF